MTKSNTALPKTPKKLKSSPAARKLIRAALRRTKGNQSAAARLLRLPNQSQLWKMLHGAMKDTPAMQAALKRAEQRSKRAWAFIPQTVEQCDAVDKAVVATLWRELKVLTKRFESIMPKDEQQNGNSDS